LKRRRFLSHLTKNGCARIREGANVERAYGEFRAEEAPWNASATFDAIYRVAKARGIEVEY